MPMPRPPNILITIADDQRFDTLGSLGHPDVRTPCLDALAARGTCFTRAHHMGSIHGAVCAPSRAMLHTGRPYHRLPRRLIEPWGPIDEESRRAIAATPLLGELLRRAGYRAHGVGKWHNGHEAFNRSFTSSSAIFFGGMADPFNTPVFAYDPTGDYAASAASPAPGHATDAFADAAIAYIRDYAQSDRATPFFLYCAFTAPHDPRTTHARWHAQYDPARIVLPPNILLAHPFDNGELRVRDELLAGFPRAATEIRRHVADYYAMIAHMDEAIGRIHAALASAGLIDDTLVVHTADHGLAVGQHGLMGKQNLYDHSVRVPLLLAGPGVTPALRDDRLCYQHDLFPTLLRAAGVTHADDGPFRNLLAAPDPSRDAVCCAYKDVQRMIRNERYKLIAYLVNGERRFQLFDLVEDPWECRDLANEPRHGDTVDALLQTLASTTKGLGDPCTWLRQ